MWETLVTAFLSSALTSTLGGLAFRFWIEPNLQRSLEDFRSQLQANSERSLEVLRSELQRESQRQALKFASIHEERKRYLLELHQRVLSARSRLREALSPVQYDHAVFHDQIVAAANATDCMTNARVAARALLTDSEYETVSKPVNSYRSIMETTMTYITNCRDSGGKYHRPSLRGSEKDKLSELHSNIRTIEDTDEKALIDLIRVILGVVDEIKPSETVPGKDRRQT